MSNNKRISVFFIRTIAMLGIVAFLLHSVSCKNKGPQQKLYDSLQSTLKYKSYKSLSENTVAPLILLYNTAKHPDDSALSEGVLRLLLGYSWVVNGKPDYAMAESNIIKDISTDDKDIKFLAHCLTAISMFEKGWKSQASFEINDCKALLNKEPKSSITQLKEMTFHLLQGTLSIYNENYQDARYHFAGFSIASGIRWAMFLADATADINDGNTKQGIKKIKAIIKNKYVPIEVKRTLSDTLIKVEKTPTLSVAKSFWNKTIFLALYNEIKNSSVPGITKITDFLDNLEKKLKID